ncbi:MAG: helix-turn-helix domain-containing protein [Clostridia bacterium]|nr:helix-turn-helix domain-containing protein [Clostridia bacterium]
MTTSEQIRVLCVRTGISLSELARRINQTPQNFNAKLKRNTITQDELNLIAKVLDVTYEQYFVLGNGELVK